MPILNAIRAQIVSFVFLVILRYLIPYPMPILVWVILQSCGATVLSMWWGMGLYWKLFQFALPMAIWVQFSLAVPMWVHPLLLFILLLIYGGGVSTRAPLYNSGSACWKALLEFIPDTDGIKFIDLGAGLGGPLAYIAKHRQNAILLGVEASPLVWLIGRLRTMRFKKNCTFRLGSIWKTDLRSADIVYAFLSPAPMRELWAKAKREMRPGTILISHSFMIPEQNPIQRIPLPGRKGACLLIYTL